jgi:hypothetical protein
VQLPTEKLPLEGLAQVIADTPIWAPLIGLARALGRLPALGKWRLVAACRRIGILIADVQHENLRGVSKGRLFTLSGPS